MLSIPGVARDQVWYKRPPFYIRKKVIKQAVGAEQKFEILAILNWYNDTFDDLIDSSDLVYPEMLCPNGQR